MTHLRAVFGQDSQDPCGRSCRWTLLYSCRRRCGRHPFKGRDRARPTLGTKEPRRAKRQPQLPVTRGMSRVLTRKQRTSRLRTHPSTPAAHLRPLLHSAKLVSMCRTKLKPVRASGIPLSESLTGSPSTDPGTLSSRSYVHLRAGRLAVCGGCAEVVRGE